ncbi:hypothetical protein Tco_1549875, partial [Tanacetum coccineum]
SPSKKKTLVTTKELVRKPAKKPKPAKKDIPSNKPSRKQSTGVQIKDTPGVSVSKKKAPTTTDRSKGIDLLSEAALLEEARVKKVLKRSRWETNIHQAGVSGDGAGFQPEVPDDPKGKSTDTHEGTGLKPGVPDVSKADSSKNVNVVLKDDELKDEDKGDTEMADVVKVNVEQMQKQQADVMHAKVIPEEERAQVQDVAQVTTTATPATHNASTNVPPLSSSHSVSSNYGSIFLNLNNLSSVTETKAISMLDIQAQHEILSMQTSSLLTILVTVIPEPSFIQPSFIIIAAPAKSIPPILPSFFPTLKQSTPIQTPTTAEATTLITTAVKEYLGTSLDDALYKVLQRYTADFIKEHSVLADVVERLKQQ